MRNKSFDTMEDPDAERSILPALSMENSNDDIDNDMGSTLCQSWSIVKATIENHKEKPTSNDNLLSSTSTVEFRIKGNEIVLNHLDDAINDNDSKDDSTIRTTSHGDLDAATGTTDGIENRNQIFRHSSSTQKALKVNSSYTSKLHVLSFCFAFLLIIIVDLAMQLNTSRALNSQLQKELNTSRALNLQHQMELNHTTSLLESYYSKQKWIEDERIKEGMSLENCWLEASVALGPCASDQFEYVKDTYKKTYDDMFLYYNRARSWWTESSSDTGNSGDSYSHGLLK